MSLKAATANMEYTGASLQNPMRGAVGLADIPSDIEVLPVQLFAEDGAPSKGLLYYKKGTSPKVGVHLMHPRADQSMHYGIVPIVNAGYAVLGRAGRWPNNDVDTLHEVLLLDFAAGLKFLKDFGCEQVVLYGSSGGSSLAAFYQAQALKPKGKRLTETAAGDPFDLNKYDLPPADGIVFIGAHVGEGHILGKLIDPAVVDEDDPLLTDPALDLYDPANGYRIGPEVSRYTPEFLARYRAAQAARMQRLDARALGLIQRRREAAAALEKLGSSATLAQQRAAMAEQHMVIYRTTADPAFVDPSIEPDGRSVFSYFSKRPDLENYGRDGFARYITPRAWLSTWSQAYSKADTIANLAEITTPFLIIHYAGDCGTRLSEVEKMLAVADTEDKELFKLVGTNHYGAKILPDGSSGPRQSKGTGRIVSWLGERFPL